MYLTKDHDTNYFIIGYIFSDNPDHVNPSVLAEQVFKEMDINKDNKISYNEFSEACLKNNQVCSMLSSKVLELVGSDC